MSTAERVNKILEAGFNAATHDTAKRRIRGMRILSYDGYSEPGYPIDGIVVVGNWNEVTEYDGKRFTTLDDTPGRVFDALEAAGVHAEWSDEWTSCHECFRAVRTSPNSYGWTPSYVDTFDGRICAECIRTDEDIASDILEQEFEGNSEKAVPFALDFEALGYVRLEDGFQSGLHPGQDADPRKIATALEDLGVWRYIFSIDSVGQFDARFSVHVHKDEISDLDMSEWEKADKRADVSPAERAKAYLRDASRKIKEVEGQEGIAVSSMREDGTAEVKKITQEEFVEGNWDE